jgi:DNA-directed RNA polymerase subunit N (RpoN/RPB10)
MIPYICCPTCGRLISKRLAEYYNELDTIKNDPMLSNVSKSQKCSKLLDKYGFTTQCCRPRIMGQPQYHKIVIS